MIKRIEVKWTKRSLNNAKKIRRYLKKRLTENEVKEFENLLDEFQKNISIFPKLYPKSNKYTNLRRAVLHKNTSVFYSCTMDKIIIVVVQDNRQERPVK
jgi:plasmid stabilization system protein ParE